MQLSFKIVMLKQMSSLYESLNVSYTKSHAVFLSLRVAQREAELRQSINIKKRESHEDHSIFFQNYEIFVQLDEFDELDKKQWYMK